MKIKVKDISFSQLLERFNNKKKNHKKPIRPNLFFRTLMRVVSIPDLHATHFKWKKIGMERLGKHEPAFILMNHSSFIDLEIASTVLYPRPFNIVATQDGFVGKNWLMRHIGCIPTKKFIADTVLVRDMMHAVRKLNDSVVMYPEAGYSFDGRSTVIPDSIGKCIKMMGIPLVMIKTEGAFSRDPLYNNLQRRKVDVTATVEYLLSAEEIKEMPDTEITELVRANFAFDSFKWQQENKIKIDEPFRADGLNRVLYKCPHCGTDGRMEGKGENIKCLSCGKTYHLNEYGKLECKRGRCEIPHIPDWYEWERECVRKDIEAGRYSLNIPVDIMVLMDTKKLYRVGSGRLTHNIDGFKLKSDDGEIDFCQKPLTSYSLNSDFNWYEIGDIICIGDNHCLYYCFPKVKFDLVAKVRLATEEIYKLLSRAVHPTKEQLNKLTSGAQKNTKKG